MKNVTPYAYALAALCVVTIGVLGGLSQPIPDVLGLVATGAIGVGAGSSLPNAAARAIAPAPEPASVVPHVRELVPDPTPATGETTPQSPRLPGGSE
ncbi:hypothetical protein [Occultella kanbiaonis]|uniref:hypothetical protein n=1 Tax=Occultella kanbiaonis TaxID=2675754 RepID=UPI0012B84874|nr:hypothetical protein [Occultella kanbiaonis]